LIPHDFQAFSSRSRHSLPRGCPRFRWSAIGCGYLVAHFDLDAWSQMLRASRYEFEVGGMTFISD